MLLHGLGATSVSWYALIGALAARHRVYAVDTIGEPGRSVHDGASMDSMADLVDWLGVVLAGLGLDRPHLVGHSFGGHLALRFALDQPARIDRLALLDPVLSFAELQPQFVLTALAFAQQSPEETRALFGQATPDDDAGRAYAELLTLGATAFPASPQISPTMPTQPELTKLDRPTLLLLAGRGEVHEPQEAERHAHRSVPGIVVRTLPDAPHALPVDASDQVDAELRSWL